MFLKVGLVNYNIYNIYLKDHLLTISKLQTDVF